MAELGSLNPSAQEEILKTLGPAERQRYGIPDPAGQPQRAGAMSGSLHPDNGPPTGPIQTQPHYREDQPQWTGGSEEHRWFGSGQGGAQ